MEAGVPGVPMVPAVVHVVEDININIDPAPVHGLNMVVETAQDHPHTVEAATQILVQIVVPMILIHSGGAGDSGEAIIQGEAGGPDFVRNKVRNMNNIV